MSINNLKIKLFQTSKFLFLDDELFQFSDRYTDAIKIHK